VSQLSGKAMRVLLGTLAISTAGTAGVLIAQSGNNVRPWLGLMDPNTASFALLIGYVSAITVWRTASRLSTRIMGLAASAILISGIVLAASRSALLGLVLLYIAITVLVLLKKIKIYVFVIALMTIFWSTVVTSLFVGPFSGLVFDRSIDFSDPAVADLNGRLQIWTQYLELVGDWGAKGYGLGIQAANVPGANFGNYDPHSVPLQLGVQLGVVGLSLWIIMVALFLRAALSCSHGHIAILMWIAIAPLALTTATADLAIFWVPFSLAGVCLIRGSDKATSEGDQGSSNIQYPIPQNQKISRVYKRYIRPRKI
jgi:O-antigen ligase